MIWIQGITDVLGTDGGMLQHMPADLAHFKVTTTGYGLVMKRTAWDSLGDPLPGRRNVVPTHDRSRWAEGTVHTGSLHEGLSLATQGLATELKHDPREGDATGLPRLWVVDDGRVCEQVLDDDPPDVLVVNVLGLDVAQRTHRCDLLDSTLMRAPGISTRRWVIDPALSNPRGQWHPTSGDTC